MCDLLQGKRLCRGKDSITTGEPSGGGTFSPGHSFKLKEPPALSEEVLPGERTSGKGKGSGFLLIYIVNGRHLCDCLKRKMVLNFPGRMSHGGEGTPLL